MSRVSIVIPVFNRTELLIRALKSLQLQTFKDFEIWVVDDHSTHDVLSSIQGFHAHYIKTNGKGVSAARNTGIRAANSEFIAFLDSDDEWAPTKLEKQVEFLKLNSDCSFVHTNELWIRNGQVVKQNAKQEKFGGRIFSVCTTQCLIGPSSVLIRKSLFDQVGLFDETFPVCEDFDLWLRIAATEDIGFLSEALTIKHGGHPDQLSRQFHSMDLWRVRALTKHLKNPNLSDVENVALRSSLRSKCEILLKGFDKHHNFEHQLEVRQYLNSIHDEAL